ncbi:uncharacterized protein [Ptychodera flava]|uniref:uncharacterized protein n=1 Tax=Ptychodera flava TaxID=63121 RepID=UPI003969C1BD
MWQIVLAGARAYAPYVTFPFAVVVGVIGYNIEHFVRGEKKGPNVHQIVEERNERQLEKLSKEDCTNVTSLKEYKGQPKFLYENTLRSEKKECVSENQHSLDMEATLERLNLSTLAERFLADRIKPEMVLDMTDAQLIRFDLKLCHHSCHLLIHV